MRKIIQDLVASISPVDKTEEEHQKDVLAWIESGAPLCRIEKPDLPPKHLVSYFVLFDTEKKKILLVHHKLAKLLLPPGGHVEKDEHPTDTVRREIQEELGLRAYFLQDNPFFITVTQTINNDRGHTDVSLWYLLKGDMTKELQYDMREMDGYEWLSLDKVLQSDIKDFDPHLHRFIDKLLIFII